jgi:uncharacterized membrane protein YdjX (TVP38/TMEM64 family)
MLGSLSKRFYIGTGLCILAGLIVVAVAIAVATVHLSKFYALIAVPVILVGFSLQVHALLKFRAENRKQDEEFRRQMGWK